MASSEGRHEIEAARARLTAARVQAAAAAKNVELAKAMLVHAESLLTSSKSEVGAAEKGLQEAEERWEVIDVDAAEATAENGGKSRKKRKKVSLSPEAERASAATGASARAPTIAGATNASGTSGNARAVSAGANGMDIDFGIQRVPQRPDRRSPRRSAPANGASARAPTNAGATNASSAPSANANASTNSGSSIASANARTAPAASANIAANHQGRVASRGKTRRMLAAARASTNNGATNAPSDDDDVPLIVLGSGTFANARTPTGNGSSVGNRGGSSSAPGQPGRAWKQGPPPPEHLTQAAKSALREAMMSARRDPNGEVDAGCLERAMAQGLPRQTILNAAVVARDIRLVMGCASCTRARAAAALKRFNGDTDKAIMSLAT